MGVPTIRPGELHAHQLQDAEARPFADGHDALADVDARALVREAAAGAVSALPEVATALAKGGGMKLLWGAVLVLAFGLGLHVLDGSRITRMEALIEWLVVCEEARQNGQNPPPLPFRLKIP